MRRSCLAVFALVLAVTPALAQQQQQVMPGQQAGKAPTRQTVLGSYTCSESVPCNGSSDASNTSADQWATYGNNCMAEAFGYANPDGFIDTTAGVDGSGCLTSKQTNSQGAGALVPRCCIITLPSQACTIHCDMVK